MAVDTSEFRHIIETQIALTWCDSTLELTERKASVLEAMLDNREKVLVAYKERATFLESVLEAQEQGWFDRFLTGFVVGTVVTAGVVVFVR